MGRIYCVIIFWMWIAHVQGLGGKPLIGEDCSVDILFVLDASGSVRGDFTNMRDFVADVARTLTVSATGHRVSLLEYSGPATTWPQFPFGFSSDTDKFVEFIRRLPFLQGTTATGKALEVAIKLLEGRRRDVITLVIVVTDGYSFDEVEQNARTIRNMGNVILFAAGVSAFINRDGLLKISGDDGHLWTNPNALNRAELSLNEYLTCIIKPRNIPTRALTTSTRSATSTTTTTAVTTPIAIATTTTTLPTTTTPVTGCELDLIFLVDFSSSVTSVYTSYVDLAIKIVDQLRVAEYYTRIGMVQYSSAARTMSTFHLNRYSQRDHVIKAMRQAEFTGGTTNTSAGLEMAREELNVEFGARPKKARQVVVVFTDGFSQVDPGPSAQRLRETGATVYAISAAESEEGADVGELSKIAGEPTRVFMINAFPNLVKTLSDMSNRCRR